MQMCIVYSVYRWVKDFLSEEHRGLDVLVQYMSSVLQQIVRSVLLRLDRQLGIIS